MQKKLIKIVNIINNRIILFTLSRYLGYVITIIRGFIVAKVLGPELFGIWGFLTLGQQYLSFTNFGLQYAINVKLAIGKTRKNTKHDAEYLGGAISITSIIAIVIVSLSLITKSCQIPFYTKYSLDRYIFLLSMSAGLYNIQLVLTNAYRAYGKLARIAISEILRAILPLLAALIFSGELLIKTILIALILSEVISITVFLVRTPLRVILNWTSWGEMINLGIPLLFYNISFYLITMVASTLISQYYSIKAMGLYSFANSITNASLLGLNAIGWIIYPEILSKSHKDQSNASVATLINNVNDIYSIAVQLIVFTIILCLPLLFFIVPEYRDVSGTLSVLLIAQAVLSSSFGYNCVTIAREKHRDVAIIGVIAACVVALLSFLTALQGLRYIWIAISVLIGAMVFTFLQAQLGTRVLKHSHGNFDAFTSVIPIGSLVAILCYLAGVFYASNTFVNLLGFSIFIISNRRKIRKILTYGSRKLGFVNK